ncbi:uncharacterized protein LOC123228001 [Mangifera indica]|uniref:uncharacterized protein LOC123228001 n=1 Tax=Mangifera indica TaxID=29780 RepID=UPI001CFC2A1B|nr:uncharacterized protein LOC123228001 [Mangifera indica]XP_044509114.1 uncharacterized protein LOC123228001 [Mangifera indica]XP_044509115.1 uncharacterized protein LOC123228001 [Mangifera indica]
MGSACCVASRDKCITSGVGGVGSELLHRNVRHSPTWSFRWDNRGRVAGEETSVTWLSDGISRNDVADIKYESAYASEEGSPLDSFPRHILQKCPVPEGSNAGNVRTPNSDQSISRNVSMDASLEQIKESSESAAVSYPSPLKLSFSVPSTSSLLASPLPSQNHLCPTSSTTTKWPRHSPGHRLLRQVSDSWISGSKSLNGYSVGEERPVVPSWSNESTEGSCAGSFDGWSMPAFSEITATSHKDICSFDNESLGFSHEKLTRFGSQISAASPVNLQTCCVCSKLLSEFVVVAVLTCGHVFHADCLENITAEIHKYDPACPVCILGEKKTLKLSEKALTSEMESKARSIKRSRNRIMDSHLDHKSFMFDHLRSSRNGGKSPKIASTSSMKSSLGKPFLKRHFSLRSKGSRSPSENPSTWKKGLFWTNSSKA